METTVWVVKCKQCSLYHRGPLVDTITDTINLPLDGPFECVLLGRRLNTNRGIGFGWRNLNGRSSNRKVRQLEVPREHRRYFAAKNILRRGNSP